MPYRQLGCCVLLLWLTCGTGCSQRSSLARDGVRPNPAPRIVSVFPKAVRTKATVPRTLRGDFEAPETLVLAYDRDWEDTILALAVATRGQARLAILVHSEDMGRLTNLGLSQARDVEVLRANFDSPWVRDYGPLQTLDDEGTLWLDFDYTWTRPADDRLPHWLSHVMRARIEPSDSVFDGGAVISNGNGLCAVTQFSLREGGLAPGDSAGLESLFEQLGCLVTAVLPEVPGERTGHADMIGQFVAEDQVLVATLDGTDSPEAALNLDRASDNLRAAAEMLGSQLAITRVPIAKEPDRFYSYVNVTRLRSRLLVPHFSAVAPETEQRAYRAISSTLSRTELVPIPADRLISHGGAIHCATLGLGSPLTKRRRRLAPKRHG